MLIYISRNLFCTQNARIVCDDHYTDLEVNVRCPQNLGFASGIIRKLEILLNTLRILNLFKFQCDNKYCFWQKKDIKIILYLRKKKNR